MGDGNFVLPTGTVTLGGREGSTRAWEVDLKAREAELGALNAVVDEAVGRHDGVRPEEQGESDSPAFDPLLRWMEVPPSWARRPASTNSTTFRASPVAPRRVVVVMGRLCPQLARSG
jgi:hypothetical protein